MRMHLLEEIREAFVGHVRSYLKTQEISDFARPGSRGRRAGGLLISDVSVEQSAIRNPCLRRIPLLMLLRGRQAQSAIRTGQRQHRPYLLRAARLDQGQSILEYAVLVGAVTSALILMAEDVRNAFNAHANAIEQELSGAVDENKP